MSGVEYTEKKSPCCKEEVWDQDCDECQASGETLEGYPCKECDGLGYIEGWFECSKCGDTFENDLVL